MEARLTTAGRIKPRPVNDIELAVAARRDFSSLLAIPSFDISSRFVKIVK
ncbi:MAG: hypothetical protein JF604_03490 [Bradyrhizobium sp.]|nr:hypothetical protein [Bradyrhizobium sp.]